MASTNHQIGFKAAQALYYAEMQASRTGTPLTHHVTINWSSLGVDPRNAVALFAKVRSQRFANWVRRPPKKSLRLSSVPTYAYVFENTSWDDEHGADDADHNVHVHWAVHVPHGVSTFEFEGMLWQWLDDVAKPTSFTRTALMVQEITQQGVVRYFIKGAGKGTATHFGKKHQPQGAIYGTRSGMSRNLGPKARRQMDTTLGIKRQRYSRRDQVSPKHHGWHIQPPAFASQS